MLFRLRAKLRGKEKVIDPLSVHFSPEQVSLTKTIRRRRKVLDLVWLHLPKIRLLLAAAGCLWLLALPYEGLWKDTYIDEHAIQPSQVTMYYDWGNVHKADRYLDRLEELADSTQADRSAYLQDAFTRAGLHTGNTSTATWAHITPPRTAGTEVILMTANWVSREGGPNLRAIAMLMSLGDFFRGQNHWAFDIVMVIGEGYLEGLEGFMQDYDGILPGLIWTAVNVDYPGHSFDHIGLFYEGVNGRLPNQDVVNTVAHVSRWAGGVPTRLHDIEDQAIDIGPNFLGLYLGNYLSAAKHLWEHGRYMALGRASGGHGVLARHRIDSVTMYCPNATGPHGFHTLGRALESTMRSLNNLLERLHASYFFYLLPRPGKFIPVGQYLPAAILLGASVTLGGFDCPSPVEGAIWLLPAIAIGALAWIVQSPFVILLALVSPQPTGTARKSLTALVHLFYGSLIPTLAMVNFPQSVALAFTTILHLVPGRWLRGAGTVTTYGILMSSLSELRHEHETLGNLAWLGVLGLIVPLSVLSLIT